MGHEPDWPSLITQAIAQRPAPIRAVEYRRSPRGSMSSPPLLVCEDELEYWVKYPLVDDGCPAESRTQQLGGMVTDHVLGRLAQKLAYDVVPPVVCVEIPRELIDAEARLKDSCGGQSHGSQNAYRNCTDRLDFGYRGFNFLPINRPRVASLAILYGLAMASDHQVIYRVGNEPLVYSVDHGNFFPNGPNWTSDGLTADPALGEPDRHVIETCSFAQSELRESVDRLANMAPQDIAEAVASPPDDWCFPESDRVAVAKYLWRRREDILGITCAR